MKFLLHSKKRKRLAEWRKEVRELAEPPTCRYLVALFLFFFLIFSSFTKLALFGERMNDHEWSFLATINYT